VINFEKVKKQFTSNAEISIEKHQKY